MQRSLASVPPKTRLSDWQKNTPEGRLLTAAQTSAKEMGAPCLVAWLMAAPMGEMR